MHDPILLWQNTIIELDWEVIAYPAYSSDYALSNYHLFRSLEHSYTENSCENEEKITLPKLIQSVKEKS